MLSSLIALASSANWAVLIAGSKGYKNYRHQADIFQIYKILVDRGFDNDHIISFAYDDIARLQENPFKDKVFNVKKGVNIYPGSAAIDYRGENVTADNILNVLKGKKTSQTPKVLKSTKEDNVLVYYNDHGTRGLLCMPSGNGKYISADEFRDALSEVKHNKMLVALEACYSASVGKHLISIPDTFTICAANETESSYSYAYDNDIATFRTNEFTNHLINFVLKNSKFSLLSLNKYMKEHVKGSRVMSYVNNSINEHVEEFFGKPSDFEENVDIPNYVPNGPSVQTTYTFIDYLKQRIKAAKTYNEKMAAKLDLYRELRRRGHSKVIFKKILAPFSTENAKELSTEFPDDPKWKCYMNAVRLFQNRCGDIDEYEIQKIPAFARICEFNNEEDILVRIRKVCPVKQWVISA